MYGWPYTTGIVTDYKCGMCGKMVATQYVVGSSGVKIYYPESLYWNLEKLEVYCSAEHSLQAYKRERECR